MSSPEAITRAETWEVRWLWFGILIGPVAWSIQLGGDWFLAEVVACSGATSGVTTGFPLHMSTAVLNGVLLAATVIGGLVSYRSWRSMSASDDPTPGRRVEWMARAGVINSVLFGVVITASYLGIFMTSGCSS